VATGKFESKDAWIRVSVAVAAAGVDFAFDERESRPREVYKLVDAC